MQVLKGPVRTMAEVTKRTVAENNMIASTKLVIISSANAPSADCDSDGFIEPIEPEDPGADPKPPGSGYLPSTVGAALNDPWGTRFFLCAWDHGSANGKCTGTKPLLLTGGPLDNQYAIAVISAGPDRIAQTTCNDFVDTTPADDVPDTPLLVKNPGTDDIVLGYTYAEANNIGGGLWTLKEGDNDKATITKDIEVRTADDSAVAFGLDRTTGMAEFMALKTDNIYAKSNPNGTIQLQDLFRFKGYEDLAAPTSSAGGDSLWTLNGSDIYYDDGNVGIGTDTPSDALHIVGSAGGGNGISAAIENTDSGGFSFLQLRNDNTGYALGVAGSGLGGIADEFFILDGDDNPRFVIAPGGDIGIGTNNPQALLHLSDIGGSPNIRFDTEAVLDWSEFNAGANYASAGANDATVGGSNSWTNPGNATTSNNSKATRALTSGGGPSQYLKVTGFGFAIPANAEVDGIVVEIEKMTSSTSSGSSCQDNSVKLVKGGTVVGDEHANAGVNWSTSDTFVSYGSLDGDNWGAGPSVADVNAADFGVAISALNSGATSRTCSVDSVRITVRYWTPDAAQPVSWEMKVDKEEDGANLTMGLAGEWPVLWLGMDGGLWLKGDIRAGANHAWGTSLWMDATDVAGGRLFAIQSTGGDHELGQGHLAIREEDGEYFMTIRGDTGNVGIGTTAPGAPLEVMGEDGGSAVRINSGPSSGRTFDIAYVGALNGTSCDTACGTRYCIGGYADDGGTTKAICTDTGPNKYCICIGRGSGGGGGGCAGEEVGGYCWYLGANNQSCDTVCATHGSCNLTGTKDYAGSGGNTANCQAVLNAVSEAPPVADTGTTDAVGCVYESASEGWRITSPTTTCAASIAWGARACACNN